MTIVNEGQGFSLTAVTRPDGTYIFTPIKSGAYRIEVESEGFKKLVRRGIQLNIQQQAVVDVTLEAGQISESVDVVAAAPLLQTQSGEVSEVLTAGRIENLP